MNKNTKYFDSSHIDVCIAEFKDFINCFQGAEKGEHTPTAPRRSFNYMSIRKHISGKKIPRLVESSPGINRISSTYLDLVRTGIIGPVGMMKEKNKKQEALMSVEEMDMLSMDQDMLGLISVSRRPHSKMMEIQGVAAGNPTEETKLDNDIVEKFYDMRNKQKLEYKHNKNAASPSTASVKKRKKRVTNLTLQIENAMIKKPPHVVEAATTTFDTLDKFRNSMVDTLKSAKASKEKNLLQKSMPNFVSAVVGMKKAKKVENQSNTSRSENIAQLKKKNTAFDSNPNMHKSGASKKEYTNYEKRLENLKSLHQLEKCPDTGNTAFDDFYCTTQTSEVEQKKYQSRLHSAIFTNHPLGKSRANNFSIPYFRNKDPLLFHTVSNVSKKKPSSFIDKKNCAININIKKNAYQKAVKIYSQIFNKKR